MSEKNLIKYIVKVDKAILHEFLNAHNADTHVVCSQRLAAFIGAHYDQLLKLAGQDAPLAVPSYSAPIYMQIDINTYAKARRILLSPQGAQVLALAYLGALVEL